MNTRFPKPWSSPIQKVEHHQKLTRQLNEIHHRLSSISHNHRDVNQAIPYMLQNHEPDEVILKAISTATAFKGVRDRLAQKLVAQKRLLKFFHPDEPLPTLANKTPQR
jgi:hypothetical protein